MQEFFIDDHGIKLHAKLEMPKHFTEGEKCPLILIVHGFTGHMEERHIIAVKDAAVSLGCAALRVEMFGHGQSDGEFADHDLYKWISNALTAIDYAKSLDFVSDLYMTGHSQGGLLTILCGGLRKKDFKAIIPLSPALCIPDMARKGELLGRPFDPNDIPDILYFDDRTLKGDYVRIAQMIYAEDMMRKYHGPVCLIHGDADLSVDVRYSIEADQIYENSRLVIIPGDTHCFDHHLEKMVEAFAEFLGEMLLG